MSEDYTGFCYLYDKIRQLCYEKVFHVLFRAKQCVTAIYVERDALISQKNMVFYRNSSSNYAFSVTTLLCKSLYKNHGS